MLKRPLILGLTAAVALAALAACGQKGALYLPGQGPKTKIAKRPAVSQPATPAATATGQAPAAAPSTPAAPPPAPSEPRNETTSPAAPPPP